MHGIGGAKEEDKGSKDVEMDDEDVEAGADAEALEEFDFLCLNPLWMLRPFLDVDS